MIKDFHPQTVFKKQVDEEAEQYLATGHEEVIKFERKKQVMKYIDPIPKIDNVHYPKSSLDKKKQTHRTALYAFLTSLKP